jgi:uncharacterized HAD superfamily protein
MRIAIDIDSTLHHYWDVLSDAALRRFGIELPYDEQFTWGITRLRAEQLRLVIEETHCEQTILAGRPYPGAVETVNRWHAEGHFIQVTSHRSEGAQESTERWLRNIGLEYDELVCSSDKIARCVTANIDLLIDDNPHDLVRALERGLHAATLRHPWNEEVCETEDVMSATDWKALAAIVDPLLPGGDTSGRANA